MRFLLPILTAFALCGCYEISAPVLETGERAPIAGTYHCTGLFRSSQETIQETSTGLLWKDYRYTNASGDILTLRKINSALFAAPIKSSQGIALVFIDAPTNVRFSIRVPDLVSHAPRIDALATRHAITATPSKRNRDFIALGGSTENTLSFISAHSSDLLTTALECNRIGS